MKRARRKPKPPPSEPESAPTYRLALYVSGATPASARAVGNLKSVCDAELAGRYDLEVIDVHERPELLVEDRIVVTPTLLKRLPLPVRRLIGDLSQREEVVVALDIRKKKRS